MNKKWRQVNKQTNQVQNKQKFQNLSTPQLQINTEKDYFVAGPETEAKRAASAKTTQRI